jgi:hypothetical protein
MDLFSALPDDILLHMFIYGGLWTVDAISCALISRRFHAAFLTARRKSFNFRIDSYASSKLRFHQKLVDEWVFWLNYIPLDLRAASNAYLSTEVRFFGCWDNTPHNADDGRILLPKYDQIEDACRIPSVDPIRDIKPFILGLVNSVSCLEKIQRLVERVEIDFKLPLQHAVSHSHIRISYNSAASKDRPFYLICFYVQLIYEKKLTDGKQRPRKEFNPDITIRGRFMESHPVETLAKYINKLLSMPKLEELRDYRITRTCHQTLKDTSIVPIWEDV